MLIDTHAHLYWESYQNDLDLVIQRAKDAGITAIINVGVDIEKQIKIWDAEHKDQGSSEPTPYSFKKK